MLNECRVVLTPFLESIKGFHGTKPWITFKDISFSFCTRIMLFFKFCFQQSFEV